MMKPLTRLLALLLAAVLTVGVPTSATATGLADEGAAQHTSGGIADPQVRPHRESRAQRWHRLNVECRGGAGDDPATRRACRERDALTRQVGKELVGRFHRAWQRNNRDAMRRMVQPSARSIVMPMLRGRASQTARDCDYGTGAHYCYFRETSGAWTGVQFTVVRIAARRLPVWKITGAAPDGV